jgi:uncharacterized membrane protein
MHSIILMLINIFICFSSVPCYCIVRYVIVNEVTPLDVRSKVWVCGRSIAGIAGFNRAGGMNVCLL